MKCLIYVTKSKPWLFFDKSINYYSLSNKKVDNDLNGKIVAEFDGEVEEIEYKHIKERDDIGILRNETWYEYRGLNIGHYDCELSKKSCLSLNEIFDYLDNKNGYAIHIKNLNVFDKPRELDYYYKFINVDGKADAINLKRAPQNMCYAYDIHGNKYVVISVHPEWACKILNGEKTIEVRKQVLNCMKGN